jgi:hypothetical protein
MWSVTIKTKKAIPGLAKILLAVILLGTIIFAVHVQNVKRGWLKIDLDTQLQVPADSGLVTFDISSKWQQRSAVTGDGEMQGVWDIPAGPKGKTASGFFFLNLHASQPKPSYQILKVLRQNHWIDRIDLKSIQLRENRENDLPYPDFDAATTFLDSTGRMLLTMKLIYLPNGSTLSFSVITPLAQQAQADYWLEKMAETVKFVPAGPLQQVEKDEELKLAPFTFRLPEKVWVKREPNLNALRFQPATDRADDLWQAQLRIISLPKFRQPNELLEDHFFKWYDSSEKISYTPPETFDNCTIYRAETVSSKSDMSQIESAWLARCDDESAVFVTLTASTSAQTKADAFIRNLLTNMKHETGSTPQPAKIDPKTLLTPSVIASLAKSVAGWYLIQSDGRTVGFRAVALTQEQPQLKFAAFSYLEDEALTYLEEEQSTFTSDLTTGGYLSQVKARIKQPGRTIDHLIVQQNRFTPNAVQMSTQIDAESAMNESARPLDFIPNIADEMLIRLMGSSPDAGPDSIMIAQPGSFKPRLRSTVLKRIDGPDDNRQIIVSTDSDTEYYVHRFDPQGQWLGYSTPNGFALDRSDRDKIQKMFPKISVMAQQKLAAMAREVQSNPTK